MERGRATSALISRTTGATPAAGACAGPHAQLLALQRGAGNAAVSRLLGGPKIARFDAGSGGHQGMERGIAGLDPSGGLAHDLSRPAPQAGEREQGVNAVYAGNFMQDFSQVNTPTFHNILANLPTDPVDFAANGGKGPRIGNAGADALSSALIRALAIVEVGPELAESTVADNMQVYRPEQHVDQPMGYSAATDALVQGDSGAYEPGRPAVHAGTGPLDPGYCAVPDPELAGSAAPGPQMENAELLEVSGAGLQNHIYNSVEWVKDHWANAARMGPTDQGRFHLGAGLHAIEDYFSHSNFVEVALNSYIPWTLSRGILAGPELSGFAQQADADRRAAGRTHAVDTLFDASVAAPDASGRTRQAVTTGSVGSNDMKSSIGHILLPALPKLQTAVEHGVNRLFSLVESNQVSGWEQFKTLAGQDRSQLALIELAEGLSSGGVTLPVPEGIDIETTTYEVLWTFDVDVPTGASIDYADVPFAGAVDTYVGWVRSVMNAIGRVQNALDYAKWLAFPIVMALKKLIKMLQDWIKDELAKLREAIKREINLMLIRIVDEIAGVDSRDEASRTLGDAIERAEHGVEHFEARSSLQSRLLHGDLAERPESEVESIVGPVRPAPGGRGWISEIALPPSHSEIAKDHAPHTGLHEHEEDEGVPDTIFGQLADMVTGGPGTPIDPGAQVGPAHDPDEGSIFYGLATALAREADRHVLRQAELVWADRGTLYGDRDGLDTRQMTVGHDEMTQQASGRAAQERARAEDRGYAFAQAEADKQGLLDARPEARRLLDLVDLIIAHPDDSTWWKPVFDGYVAGHADEVARHIRERNGVRARRR